MNFDAAMLIPLLPVLILAALLIGWSLIDIARKPVQHLPKWAWALIVLLAIPIGAVIYLIIGRTRVQKLRDEDLR
ncbi:PLD nuclease N-terminal domain-containing protein [Microbacterium esteraromaticum]|uniref:PLD nuclease N-terminal domain-containing protein n=1 Tax=Microbacterium esteraromaticum TaxID=57043 RepID=UPI00211B3C9F|nr:PLD nuclease N-terminal domain-containing protein [Microbacterium esteraromaticum]